MKICRGFLVLLAGVSGVSALVAGERPAGRDHSSLNGANVSIATMASQPSLTDLTALAGRAEDELRGNILPFWLKHTRNRERGGFYGLIDEKMRAHPEEPRGAGRAGAATRK